MMPPTEKPSAGDAWLKTLIGVLSFPLAYFLVGTLGTTLWRWFVTPVFASAPHLTAGQFAGLWLCVRWFTGGGPLPKKPEQTVGQYVSELALNSFIGPLFVLLIAWSIRAVWL